MSTRSLGSIVVRLAVELAKYKADWREAADATKDGAAKVEAEAGRATAGIDKLTNAASKLPGELGNTATKATQMVGAIQAGTGASLALAGGLAAAAAAAGVAAYAAVQGAKEQRALNDQLILTGNYAGLVTGQLDRMALGLANSLGGTVSSSRQVLSALVATGRFTVDSLGEVGAAVQLVARFSGQTNEQVVKDFAGMANGVAKWAEKSNEAYHFLDLATYRYIKSLEEQGDKQGAMRVTSEALSKHLGGDLTQNLGYLDNVLNRVSGSWSRFWAAAKDLGKDKGLDAQIAALSDSVEKAKAGWSAGSARSQAAIQAQQDELRSLLRRKEIIDGNTAAQSASAQATERAMKADDEWGKIVDRNAGRQQRMNKELDEARKAAQLAGKSAADLAQVEAEIRDRYKERSTKDKADPYDALIKSARERVAVLELEATATDKVTESQKLLAKYETDLADGTLKFNAIKDQAYRLTLAQMEADERAVVMKDRVAKATVEAAKAHEAHIKALTDGLDKQQTELDKQLEHNAALGLSKTAVAELTAAKLEDQAATLQGIAIAKVDRDLNFEMYDLRKKEVDLLRERAKAIRSGAAKEEMLDAAKEAAKANERMWESMDRTAHDVFVSMDEGFTNLFTKAGKTLKATVLDLLYQLTVHKFFVNIGANVSGAGGGIGGLASGAGGAMNLAGGLGGLSTWGSGAMYELNAGTFVGNIGAGMAGTGGSFASSVGGGLATDAMGASVAEGSAAATLGSGSTIGSALAAIPGWGWAAMAALAVFSLSQSKGGPKSEGGYAPGGMNIGGLDIGGNMQGSQRGDVKTAEAISKGISDSYANAANLLGLKQKTANVGVFYASDPEGTSMSQVQVVTDGYDRSKRLGGIENVGRNPEDMQAEFAAETSRLIIAKALQDSGLDQSIKDYFAKIDIGADGATLAKAIDNAAAAKQLKDVLGQFGPVFEGLANISVEAKTKMAEAAGGIQQLVAGLSAYNANFLTPAEQRLQVAKNILSTVNGAGGNFKLEDVLGGSREQFRAAVEAAAKDTSEEGVKLWTALISVAGAFAQITPAAEKAADAVVDQAAADRQATDAALQALQRAISARRDAAARAAADSQDLVARLQSIFDLLRGHVRDLYGEVESTAQMAAAQGEAFIAIALAKARAGGGLPQEQGLSEAIDAARGGLASRVYTKQADKDFDRLVLAGQLKALADIAGPQLTAAEKQAQADQQALEYLDALEKDAKDQLEAMRNVGAQVGDLTEMVARFWQAFNKEKGGAAGSAGAGAAGGSAAAGGSPFVFGAGGPEVTAKADGKLGVQGGVLDLQAMFNAGTSPAEFAAKLQYWGKTQGEAASALGLPIGVVNDYFDKAGIPRFGSGGDHAGGWMKAGEFGEELIWSPPARVFNATDTDRMLSGGGETAAAMRELQVAMATMARELAAIKESAKQQTRYLKGSTRGGSPVGLVEVTS